MDYTTRHEQSSVSHMVGAVSFQPSVSATSLSEMPNWLTEYVRSEKNKTPAAMSLAGEKGLTKMMRKLRRSEAPNMREHI